MKFFLFLHQLTTTKNLSVVVLAVGLVLFFSQPFVWDSLHLTREQMRFYDAVSGQSLATLWVVTGLLLRKLVKWKKESIIWRINRILSPDLVLPQTELALSQ